MRAITALVFFGVVAVACGYIVAGDRLKYADKGFLVKQKAILDVLRHVHQPEVWTDFYNVAAGFKIYEHYDMYTNVDAVKEFVKFYKFGMLGKDDIFSIFNQLHRDWAVSLFHTFYYAKDWETFFNTMVWAKFNINEGLFIYALSVAVIHRPDMVGIELPAPYELYPYYFFNAGTIEQAHMYKIRGFDKMKSVEGFTDIIIPTNYTGSYMNFNLDSKVSYFTEDIGLNSYYYYFHLDYPFWLSGKEFNLYKDRRGDLFLYMHQQLLARYYMERLSNDLGEIPELSYYYPVKTGYYPGLRYYNGLMFPSRDNDYVFYQENNYYFISLIEDYERRIRDAIDYGFVTLPDGTHIDLTKPESIDYLGMMVQGNLDIGDNRFFRYLEVYSRILLGGDVRNFDFKHVQPSVLEHYETALRDPLFYMLYKRLIKNFYQFKDNLKHYTHDDLVFRGVKIEGINMDKLVTYFDKYDSDITNAIDFDYSFDKFHTDVDSKTYHGSDFVIKARQWRLNHFPFTIKMNVFSEKPVKSVVRMYLAPKYDEFGNLYSLNDNRENFWLFETFTVDLKSGKNVVVRNSQDFTWFVKDRTPYYELYKWVMAAYKGETKFPLDVTEAHCGFPQRLLLPKGKKMGMPFQFFFIITPYVAPTLEKYSTYDSFISCGVGSGSKYVDGLPFGYPFDRFIDSSEWYTPNMFFYDTFIFHKKETDFKLSHQF